MSDSPRVMLSARLAAVAALVPPGLPMADIGTDHGRLPAWLVESGRVPRAVGVDDKAAPLAGAQALGATLGRGAALVYQLGSGCAGLVDIATVTVAGMGGPLIARIVAGARAAGARHLVLQPNIGEAELRAWLDEHGWAIDAEVLVTDRGRRFVVVSAVYAGGGPRLDAVDYAYGAAGAHRDPEALESRLDDDEARIRALLARHDGARADTALGGQLQVVARTRARLRRVVEGARRAPGGAAV